MLVRSLPTSHLSLCALFRGPRDERRGGENRVNQGVRRLGGVEEIAAKLSAAGSRVQGCASDEGWQRRGREGLGDMGESEADVFRDIMCGMYFLVRLLAPQKPRGAISRRCARREEKISCHARALCLGCRVCDYNTRKLTAKLGNTPKSKVRTYVQPGTTSVPLLPESKTPPSLPPCERGRSSLTAVITSFLVQALLEGLREEDVAELAQPVRLPGGVGSGGLGVEVVPLYRRREIGRAHV